jgi:hypothetical protein
VLVPAVNSMEASAKAGTLDNVLVDQVGLSGLAGKQLLSGLGAIGGATVYPLYSPSGSPAGPVKKLAGGGARQAAANGPASGGHKGGDPQGGGNGGVQVAPGGGQSGGPTTIVSCAVMRELAVLGQCAPGAAAVTAEDGGLFGDNPLFDTKAWVSAADPAYTGPLAGLPLQAVLVRVNSPATLERVRTYLAVHTAPAVSGGPGSSPTPPRTFGETLGIRLDRAATLEKIVYAAVALTLIVAGCSLAVAVGGGLVDRRRPFTLLRVSGTQAGVLSWVVVLEAAVPLFAATLVAAGIAYGTSILAFVRLAPAKTAIPQLGHDYYALIGVGLAVAFAVISATLPLLRSMTAPGNVRFE